MDLPQTVYVEWDEDRTLGVRRSFVERSSQYDLDLSEEIKVSCPVTILHGVEDQSVPYQVLY